MKPPAPKNRLDELAAAWKIAHTAIEREAVLRDALPLVRAMATAAAVGSLPLWQDELASRVLTRLPHAFDSFEGRDGAGFKRYLQVILKNSITDLIRAEKRQPATVPLDAAPARLLAGPQQPQFSLTDVEHLLSARENEIAALLAHGHRQFEIADRLSIRAGTVATFCGRIRKKIALYLKTNR